MYIPICDLPEVLRHILKEHKYRKRDVSVEPRTEISLQGLSGKGQQAYTAVVNLATGQYRTYTGSWGGPNIFNPGNRVDLDDSRYIIPMNGAVVKGSQGYYSYANVYLHPNNLQQLLPSKLEISETERSVLHIYQQYKSAYRKEYKDGHHKFRLT